MTSISTAELLQPNNSIDKIKQDREVWLDYSKAIGSISIVVGHLRLIDPGPILFTHAFNIPLFFLVSGYLYKQNSSWDIALKKDFKRLLLPYTYFYIITYALWLVPFLISHKNDSINSIFKSGFVKPALGWLFGVGYETGISLSINHPIWFLVGLFVSRTIFRFLDRISKGNKVYIAIGVGMLVAAIVLIRSLGYDLLFSIDSAILSLPFLLVGFLLKHYGVIKSVFKGNALNFLYFLILFALLIALDHSNGRSDANSTHWGGNLALFYLAGLAGTFMVFAITMILARYPNKLILFFAANTIVVVGLQSKIKSISIAGLKIIGHRIPAKMGTSDAILVTLLIVLLCLPIMYIIDKYFPFLLGGTKKQIQPAI